MNMFKKIISYFREEIEIINEDEMDKAPLAEEKPDKPVQASKPALPPVNKSSLPVSSFAPEQPLSARVAYRYPTVKQPPLKAAEERRSRAQASADGRKAEPQLKLQEYPRKEAVYTPASRVAPRPFKPSEIPSPIYGFRARPVQEDARSVRREERKAAQNKEPLLLVPKEQSPRPERAEETQAAQPPLEKPTLVQNESGKLPEPKRAEKPRERRHSPFNVVMLKKDREKANNPALKARPAPQAETEKRPPVPAQVKSSPAAAPGGAEARPEVFSEEERVDRPPLSFLTPPAEKTADEAWVQEKSSVLNETLKSFNINAHVTGVTTGPAITRFEITPAIGVKVSKIVSLADDIKRSLAARTIRIEAPIPGTQVVGIELPNDKSRPVFISEIIGHAAFQSAGSPLSSALGLDIAGNPVVLDLQKMPHGLIAGATGSGKSVCINSILVSLLYKTAPHELKLLLIDPKMVELTPYNGIPHLASPVITDVKAATAALKWAVEEMERRYQLFVHAGVRDMKSYNEKAAQSEYNEPHLPYLVIVIDELADLMMMAPGEVEESICRIAQKARACGIHLIVATQRPSVDVITGLIKANIPTRIAFSVSSQIDSRTILDKVGADKLLGKGDMLFLDNGSSEAVRLQGTFVTNEEIDEVVRFVSEQQKPSYLFEQEELLQKAAVHNEGDELFTEACELVVRQGGASTSMLQRSLKVGYNRAARLIEMMEEQGFVSGQRAGRPREVLVSEDELYAFLEESNG